MNTTIFSILLIFTAYFIGDYLAPKINFVLLNKFMIATIILLAVLIIFKIDVDEFYKGGNFMMFFLSFGVISLALPLYKNKSSISKHLGIFFFAIIFGIILNTIIVYFTLKLFDLPYDIIISLYTKSITTPMSMSLNDILGAEVSLAVLTVSISAFVAGIFGKLIIHVTKTKNEFSKGLALSLYSHLVGSFVALEESEEAGAVAVSVIAVAGVLTILILPLILPFLI